MVSYPEVRIKDAWLLRQAASVRMHELLARDGEGLADDERMKEIVESYKRAWRPYEQKVLTGMCDVLGLEFRQNIIDVHIAPWFEAISDPMVIGVIYEPDRFVEVLTHELVHRLLTDNAQTEHTAPYVDEWRRLFGDDRSHGELVHIPVHAVLQAVFDDVIGEPERTRRDKKFCEQRPEYKAAWRYVEAHGYKEIIKQLRNSYREIEERQLGKLRGYERRV